MDSDVKLKNDSADASADDGYATPGGQDVFVISRVALNYVVIAVVFLLLGGYIGYSAAMAGAGSNADLIRQAVSAAVSALPNTAGAGAGADSAAPPAVAVSADDDPSLGPVDAPVTIIEFSDFRCQYCLRFKTETFDQILTNYQGRVRYVIRDLPILGDESYNAAIAAECADDQGVFWDYHDLLFANQRSLSRDNYLTFATQLNMDVTRFTTCIDQRQTLAEVVADQSDAQRLGITGTPGFFINGRFVSGAQPYSVFAAIIDQELAKAGQPTPAPQ